MHSPGDLVFYSPAGGSWMDEVPESWHFSTMAVPRFEWIEGGGGSGVPSHVLVPQASLNAPARRFRAPKHDCAGPVT